MNEESIIQTALVYWIKRHYPDLLFTIAPNGMKLPISVAAKFKKLGYAKGTPDLLIFESRGIHNGLMIELKTEKGRITPEQYDWLGKLNDRGYRAVVCRSVEEAIIVIKDYLK